MPRRPPSIRAKQSPTPVIGGEQRLSSCKRGYGRRWRAASAGYLAAHPLCVMCEAAGRIEPATVVDHIVPHRGDMGRFWDAANWQALCATHHNQKTRRGE